MAQHLKEFAPTCCKRAGANETGDLFTPSPSLHLNKEPFMKTTFFAIAAAATPTAQEAVQVTLTYSQKLEALSLRFYQGMTWNPKAGDYYTTSRADLELYRVVKVEDGMVKTQYCDQRNTDAVASWPVEEFTSAGFGPKRVWVPDFVLSAHPPQPSVSVAEAAKLADAIEACDWSGSPIGNKMILRAVVKALRALKGDK